MFWRKEKLGRCSKGRKEYKVWVINLTLHHLLPKIPLLFIKNAKSLSYLWAFSVLGNFPRDPLNDCFPIRQKGLVLRSEGTREVRFINTAKLGCLAHVAGKLNLASGAKQGSLIPRVWRLDGGAICGRSQKTRLGVLLTVKRQLESQLPSVIGKSSEVPIGITADPQPGCV